MFYHVHVSFFICIDLSLLWTDQMHPTYYCTMDKAKDDLMVQWLLTSKHLPLTTISSSFTKEKTVTTHGPTGTPSTSEQTKQANKLNLTRKPIMYRLQLSKLLIVMHLWYFTYFLLLRICKHCQRWV